MIDLVTYFVFVVLMPLACLFRPSAEFPPRVLFVANVYGKYPRVVLVVKPCAKACCARPSMQKKFRPVDSLRLTREPYNLPCRRVDMCGSLVRHGMTKFHPRYMMSLILLLVRSVSLYCALAVVAASVAFKKSMNYKLFNIMFNRQWFTPAA